MMRNDVSIASLSNRSLIHALLDQERQALLSLEHIHGQHVGSVPHDGVFIACHNQIWRESMIQWAFSVVDSFGAPREIVFLFSHILDRFLRHEAHLANNTYHHHYHNCYRERASLGTDPCTYQTLAATAFLIAMKLEGNFGIELSHLVRWSHHTISSQDIVHMGKELVRTLSWECPMPTPVRFIFEYLQVFVPSYVSESARSFWLDEANFLLELSLLDYMISCQPPSLVALLALKVTLISSISPPHVGIDWSASIHAQVLNQVDACIDERNKENRDPIMEIYWTLQRLRSQSAVKESQAMDRVFDSYPRRVNDINTKPQVIPFTSMEVDKSHIESLGGYNSSNDRTQYNMDGCTSATVIPIEDDALE